MVLAGAALVVHQMGKSQPPRTPQPLPPVSVVQPAPLPRVETIEVVYSTEKRAWIQAVTADFEKGHPDIHVDLVGKSSIVAAREILDGQLKATVWSPSDTALLDTLGSDWQTKHNTEVFVSNEDAKQPLILTPLVFVALGVQKGIAGILAENHGDP